LQNAWIKYGEGAFELRVVQEIPEYHSGPAEAFWARELCATYNIDSIDPTTGVRVVSSETRMRLSEALMGNQLSAESRAKISSSLKGEKHPNFGKPLDEKTKAKIGLSHTGEKSWIWGKKHSSETIEKMRLAKQGEMHNMFNIPRSKETREKIRLANKKRVDVPRKSSVFSEEGKANSIRYKKGRPIIGQSEITGEIVKFASVNLAKEAGHSGVGIKRCLDGRYDQYDGYCWQIDEEALAILGESGLIRKGKAIISKSVDTGIETIYRSIRFAARSGFNRKLIQNCLKGLLDTHKGFEWRYEGSDDGEEVV
jgi:hypothetical protein